MKQKTFAPSTVLYLTYYLLGKTAEIYVFLHINSPKPQICRFRQLIPTTLKGRSRANEIKNYDAFYVAYEAKDGKTLAGELIKNESKLKKVAVMIGAEGGFSEDEIEHLEQNGAIIVSLGKRILRTETAAIACSALVMQILEK